VELYNYFYLLSRLLCRDLSPDSHDFAALFLVIKTDLLLIYTENTLRYFGQYSD